MIWSHWFFFQVVGCPPMHLAWVWLGKWVSSVKSSLRMEAEAGWAAVDRGEVTVPQFPYRHRAENGTIFCLLFPPWAHLTWLENNEGWATESRSPGKSIHALNPPQPFFYCPGQSNGNEVAKTCFLRARCRTLLCIINLPLTQWCCIAAQFYGRGNWDTERLIQLSTAAQPVSGRTAFDPRRSDRSPHWVSLRFCQHRGTLKL